MTVLETCVIISKKVKSSNTLKEASSYPIQGYDGVGGYTSYDGTRGIDWTRPGCTNTETDNHPCSLVHSQTTVLHIYKTVLN